MIRLLILLTLLAVLMPTQTASAEEPQPCRIVEQIKGRLWIVQPAALSNRQIAALYNFLWKRVEPTTVISGRAVVFINPPDFVTCEFPRVLEGLQYTVVLQWFDWNDVSRGMNIGNLMGDMSIALGARLEADGGAGNNSADYWRIMGYTAHAGNCAVNMPENADCEVLQGLIGEW